jgi:ornithine carbamoyltransferase
VLANEPERPRIGQRIYAKRGLDALEVTDEVFESPASVVF